MFYLIISKILITRMAVI